MHLVSPHCSTTRFIRGSVVVPKKDGRLTHLGGGLLCLDPRVRPLAQRSIPCLFVIFISIFDFDFDF